jgi:serine/threonine protein kinase
MLSGAYATVYSGICLRTGKHVAVKSSERDGTDRVLKARSEAAILKRLSGHKNIVGS